MKTLLKLLVVCAFPTVATADPQIASWFTLDSGKFAQIYRTDAERFSGKTETTADEQTAIEALISNLSAQLQEPLPPANVAVFSPKGAN